MEKDNEINHYLLGAIYDGYACPSAVSPRPLLQVIDSTTHINFIN